MADSFALTSSYWTCKRRFMKESKLLYKVSGHHEHQLAKLSSPAAAPGVTLHNSSAGVRGICPASQSSADPSTKTQNLHARSNLIGHICLVENVL